MSAGDRAIEDIAECLAKGIKYPVPESGDKLDTIISLLREQNSYLWALIHDRAERPCQECELRKFYENERR